MIDPRRRPRLRDRIPNPENPVTREPAEPRSNDEASLRRRGGTAGARPTATWEADDGALPEVGTWEAADGSPGVGVRARGQGLRRRRGFDPDIGLIVRKEPWRLSHLMLAIVGVAVVLWLWITLRLLAIVLTPFAMIVMGITAGFVLARLRASRQEALLSLLAIASERGMPLAPAVSAFADQFRGRAQRRILEPASPELEWPGRPLPEALEETSAAPSRAMRVLMARVGHETGLLAPALRLVGGSRPPQVGTGRPSPRGWPICSA